MPSIVARAAHAGWGAVLGGARGALLALAAAGCADRAPDPLAPAAAAARPGGRRAAVAPAPAATMTVPVEVPASMRWAPFDVERTLTVPPGFAARVYARVSGARFMAVAPNGDLLVSNPGAGKVVLVRPGAGGGDPQVSDWAVGLYRPHDVVFHVLGGRTFVYVAEADKVARYRYEEGDATGRGREEVVTGLPSASTPELGGAYGHELKNIALSGDKLYVSIASTCNACVSDTQSDPVRGAVYEYDAGGGAGRLYARGLRNAEGLAFVPGTSTLWAAVNNRDNVAYPHHRDFDGDGQDDYGRVMQGYVDGHPPEELTRVRDGGNYGWPFCNPDPDGPRGVDDMPFVRDVEMNADGSRLDCDAADRISKGIQAHSAPLGLTFLQGTAAPQPFRRGALVALHGSWNRSTKVGYKVVHFAWDEGAGVPGGETDFVTGWATPYSQWGRPVDVAVAPDGAIYVSDDYSGTIYRVARGRADPPDGPVQLAAGEGRCLDVWEGSREIGAEVRMYGCHGGANQRWSLPPVGEAGEVRVYGALCLDVWEANPAEGARVSLFPCHGGANQQWARTAVGELRGLGGKCLDVLGGAVVDGAPVGVHSCHGGANQRWGARP